MNDDYFIPAIPEPYRLNNLFQLDNGTWRANIRNRSLPVFYEYGEGLTPHAAIIAALKKEQVDMARTAGSKNKPKGEGASLAAGGKSTPKKVADTKRSALFEALKFVSVASKDDAGEYQAHVNIQKGQMVAFNGVIAAGCMIDASDNIAACPQTKAFMKAVERCGPDYAVTQLPNDRLSIRSGAFKAVVPCISETVMPQVFPDAISGVFNEAVREALITVGKLVSDTGTTVVEASVLLHGTTALATDRITVLEVWHGCEFPRMTLPKAFVNALAKVTKKPVSFGASENSLTVFFEDNSFIKTQLYSEPFPEMPGIMPDGPNGMVGFPAELWVGLDKLLPFVDPMTNGLFLTNEGLRTGEDETASTYDIEGMLDTGYLSATSLKFIQPHCALAVFPDDRELLQFFNEAKTIRGAIALRVPPGDRQPAPAPVTAPDEPGDVPQSPTQGSGWNDPVEGLTYREPAPAPAPVIAPVIAPVAVPDPAEPFIMAQDDAVALYNEGRLVMNGNDWFIGTHIIRVDQISAMGKDYWLNRVGVTSMSPNIDVDASLDEDDKDTAMGAGGWQT